MIKIKVAIAFMASSLLCQGGMAVEPLKLEGAYLLDGVEALQPSGLSLCDGRLLFVSDKHESQIFQIDISDNETAEVSTYLTIKNIPKPPEQDFTFAAHVTRFLGERLGLSGGMDWEGMACNEEGELFLVSEYYFSVLKVNLDGSSEWVVDDLYRTGKDAGLFKKDNAYIEGIVVDEEGITLVAEREPRGVITVPFFDEKSVFVQPGEHLSEQNLPYDYTGLESYGGSLIFLERNHYQICDRKPPEYYVEACFSYKSSERSEEWGYDTGKFGLAEGIAIDGKDIWIIVDNNGESRLKNSEDTRPTIMKFNNPFAF